MAYIVTGYEPVGNGKYYFLNTDTGKVCTTTVDAILTLPSKDFNIPNIKIKHNLKSGNILTSKQNTTKSIHSTNWELVKGGKVISGGKTLVIIDFNKNKFGVIGSLDRELIWDDISLLENVINTDVYNNIAISRESCKLNLDNYFIIGKRRDIVLNRVLKLRNINNRVHTEQSSKKSSNSEAPEKVGSQLEALAKQSETLAKQSESLGRTSDEIDSQSVTSVKQSETLVDAEYYKNVLRIMRDNDTITFSKDIFKKLKFSLISNLDKTLLLDKRISVGTLKIGNSYEESITAIIKYDDSSEYVRVQIFKSMNPDKTKSYSLENLTREYNAWLNRNRFIGIR